MITLGTYVYVMFATITVYGNGVATTMYEFEDKIQCENAVNVFIKRAKSQTTGYRFEAFGYCLEVRK